MMEFENLKMSDEAMAASHILLATRSLVPMNSLRLVACSLKPLLKSIEFSNAQN
jgi:hypothetical protein